MSSLISTLKDIYANLFERSFCLGFISPRRLDRSAYYAFVGHSRRVARRFSFRPRAASADMVYGVIGAFGLSALQMMLVGQANWLRIVGGSSFDLSWGENLFVKTSRASRTSFTRRRLWRISLHLVAHAYQPDDHSLVHRHLRRVANQQHERKLSFTDIVSDGGLLRVSGLVAELCHFWWGRFEVCLKRVGWSGSTAFQELSS